MGNGCFKRNKQSTIRPEVAPETSEIAVDKDRKQTEEEENHHRLIGINREDSLTEYVKPSELEAREPIAFVDTPDPYGTTPGKALNKMPVVVLKKRIVNSDQFKQADVIYSGPRVEIYQSVDTSTGKLLTLKYIKVESRLMKAIARRMYTREHCFL